MKNSFMWKKGETLGEREGIREVALRNKDHVHAAKFLSDLRAGVNP